MSLLKAFDPSSDEDVQVETKNTKDGAGETPKEGVVFEEVALVERQPERMASELVVLSLAFSLF